MISHIYKSTIFEEKRNSFEAIARRTTTLTESYINHKISSSELNSAINGMSYSADAMIYVLEIDKDAFSYKDSLSSRGLSDDFISTDMVKILNGQNVFRQNEYSKEFETDVIFSGYPLTINQQIQGTILIFCPVRNINQNVNKMNYMLWISAVIVFLISIPFIFFNSRRISKPILKIEAAARNIATGGKSEDLEINLKDELGMLAHSFNNMKEQLEINEKMRREFIADISHELRTPLTSIHGFVQGILDHVISKEHEEEYLILIQEETERLVHLTSELLEIAKIESGTISLKIETIGIKNVVDTVISVLQVNANKKGIHIASHIDSSLMVSMDLERLKQILMNILSNAIKYTSNGGEVFIFATNQSHLVEIVIKDNGIGINQEELPYIFEKFYRANKSRSSGDESTGLGLSIVKNLVVLSGGTIRIESQIGKGTTVSFTLNKAESF